MRVAFPSVANTTKTRTPHLARRPRGTGALFVKRDRGGWETWYGKWRVGSTQVKRRIAPKRIAGTRDGLTRTQAEAELRRLIGAVSEQAVSTYRASVEDGAELVLARARARGRKLSTVMAYESVIRVHLVPFFGERPLHEIGRREIEAFARQMTRNGRSVKTTFNALGILHSIFEAARREEWVAANPCTLVDKPRAEEADPDIRFLEPEEVEALLRVVPDDDLGRVERRMYLAAAMTGMRQGELLALRWRDIDWPAQRVRVRRNFVRGEFGTPKSKRSSRSVPLADRLAGELDQLHRATVYARDDDLVFAHPHTGKPIDRSKLLKRFKAALERAGVRPVRFHDLRHTFGTRMAAQGVPMRALQEMMGHRDFKTTLIYADYAPSAREAEWVEAAFASRDVARQPKSRATPTRSAEDQLLLWHRHHDVLARARPPNPSLPRRARRPARLSRHPRRDPRRSATASCRSIRAGVGRASPGRTARELEPGSRQRAARTDRAARLRSRHGRATTTGTRCRRRRHWRPRAAPDVRGRNRRRRGVRRQRMARSVRAAA